MANVTIFVGSEYKNPDVYSVFSSHLEKALSRVSGLSVSTNVAGTQDCNPPIILALSDFGGLDQDLGKTLTQIARQLARQHFGVLDKQIDVTIQGTFKG